MSLKINYYPGVTMGIRVRIEKLEQRQHAQEIMSQPRLSGDDVVRKLGLDPDELRTEQRERSGHLSLLEIMAEKIGIPFAEFKALLKAKARGEK